MGHNLSMGSIRFLAFTLPKAFKQLFQNVFVNVDGVEKVRKMLKETPVILLPTHRSYIDFLILSYVLYHYDLPLPCIAAGQDFMSMKFVGTLLRNCGAFYMRRSFGSDKLYWAVFTEYVQSLVINGDAPVEFFLEGTRSRTSKSLPPKQGLLATIVEAYFNGKATDISFVPVSITYNRVLEEVLYGREMLGVPKPKESTSGLFKARSILSDDYGPFHIYFSDPISLRACSEGKVDRSVHNLVPRFRFSLTREEQKFLTEFSYQVLLQQQKYLVVSVWSLVATLLLQNNGEMKLTDLYREVEWLSKYVSSNGAYIDWPAMQTVKDVVQACLKVHHSVALVTKDGRVVAKSNVDDVVPKPVPQPTNMTRDEIMTIATVYVVIGHYRNQLTHVFVRMALVAIAMGEQTSCLKDHLFADYRWLVQLLFNEFIFHPTAAQEDFHAVLKKFHHSSTVIVADNEVRRHSSGDKLLTFLQQMFRPFLLGYWAVCQYLLAISQGTGSEQQFKQKILIKGVQDMMVDMISAGEIPYYDLLSTNLIDNALKSLVTLKALQNTKRNGETLFVPVSMEIAKIADRIAGLIQVHQECTATSRLQSVVPAQLKAKI
ncbi:dihydroxyacetone phosphate acyltransferase-like isoform X2 [Glandiceps talaboti]